MLKNKLTVYLKIKKSITAQTIKDVIDEIIGLEPELAEFYLATHGNQFKDWIEDLKKRDFLEEVNKYNF
jgi:hypothetical protein